MTKNNGYIIAQSRWTNYHGATGMMTNFLGKDRNLYLAISRDTLLTFKTKGQAKEELSKLASQYKTTQGWIIIGPNGGVTAY